MAGQVVPVGGTVPESALVPIGGELPESALGGGPTPAPTPAAPSASPARRYVSNLAQSLNPLPLIKTLTDDSQVDPREAALLRGAGAPPGLGNLVRGLWDAQVGEFSKAKESYDRGDYDKALAYAFSGLVPVAGPAVTSAGEQIGRGDVAGGLGSVSALAIPLPGPKGLRAVAKAPGAVAERVAQTLQRGAERRVVDVIAPKVGQNKQRFGRMAADVAPEILKEPGMGTASRAGLADKIESRLEQAEFKLDEATAARNPNELTDTGPIIAQLQERLKRIQAETAVGPEAHYQVERMGISTLPERPPAASMKFAELPVAYKQELRRIVAELEEFQYQEGRKVDRSQEVAREGGYGTGRGARTRSATATAAARREYVPAVAGTPVYHEVLQGKTGTTRNAMIKSLAGYIEGRQRSTPVVDRAITLADKRLRDPDAVARPMLPKEAGFADVDVAGPLGQNVTPGPNQPRAAVIQRVIQEIKDLGPAATYDSLRKIRQGWDQVAKAVYNPSLTGDFMVKNAEKLGAADATGVLRESMSILEPATSKANAEYSLWRKAADVMRATEEVERTRPRVGRQIMARGTGAMVGTAAYGLPGALAGVILGPGLDGLMAAGVTTKIASAKILAKLAEAVKQGQGSVALARLRQFASLTGQLPKLNQLLKEQEAK